MKRARLKTQKRCYAHFFNPDLFISLCCYVFVSLWMAKQHIIYMFYLTSQIAVDNLFIVKHKKLLTLSPSFPFPGCPVGPITPGSPGGPEGPAGPGLPASPWNKFLKKTKKEGLHWHSRPQQTYQLRPQKCWGVFAFHVMFCVNWWALVQHSLHPGNKRLWYLVNR